MKRVIYADQAIEALRKAVDSKGELYVYDRGQDNACKYVRDGKPDCGVGVALVEFLGLSIEQMVVLEGNGSPIQDIAVKLDNNPIFGLTLDEKAVKVFRAFQTMQDSGRQWGWALEDAEKEYERLSTITAPDAPTW